MIEPTRFAIDVVLHHLVRVDDVICQDRSAVISGLDALAHRGFGSWHEPVTSVRGIVHITIVGSESIRQPWIELTIVIVR